MLGRKYSFLSTSTFFIHVALSMSIKFIQWIVLYFQGYTLAIYIALQFFQT